MREIKSFIHIFSFGDLLLFYHPYAAVCFFCSFFTLATVAADWRMMLLLREPLRGRPGGRGGRRAERREENSSGGVAAPRGAVAVMGELSNGPLSKLPSERHVTTRD